MARARRVEGRTPAGHPRGRARGALHRRPADHRRRPQVPRRRVAAGGAGARRPGPRAPGRTRLGHRSRRPPRRRQPRGALAGAHGRRPVPVELRAGAGLHQRARPRRRVDRAHGQLHSLRPLASGARDDDGSPLAPVRKERWMSVHDAVVDLMRRELDAAEYEEIRELWKRHSIAEDSRDLPGLISTLTEDCVYELVQTGERWEGHEGAARFYTELLTAFPDIHFDLTNIVIGPQGVCEEASVTGTHEAKWLR